MKEQRLRSSMALLSIKSPLSTLTTPQLLAANPENRLVPTEKKCFEFLAHQSSLAAKRAELLTCKWLGYQSYAISKSRPRTDDGIIRVRRRRLSGMVGAEPITKSATFIRCRRILVAASLNDISIMSSSPLHSHSYRSTRRRQPRSLR